MMGPFGAADGKNPKPNSWIVEEFLALLKGSKNGCQVQSIRTIVLKKSYQRLVMRI